MDTTVSKSKLKIYDVATKMQYSGTRSGSGRLVKEHFQILQQIWGGCQSVTALPMGLSSQINEDGVNISELEEKEDTVSDEEIPLTVDNIPDNKRDNMKKKLSAHQREMMLIDIARKELQLKTKAVDTLQVSMENSDKAMKMMSDSIISVGNGIKEGLALLAQSFAQSNVVFITINGITPHISHDLLKRLSACNLFNKFT